MESHCDCGIESMGSISHGDSELLMCCLSVFRSLSECIFIINLSLSQCLIKESARFWSTFSLFRFEFGINTQAFDAYVIGDLTYFFVYIISGIINKYLWGGLGVDGRTILELG